MWWWKSNYIRQYLLAMRKRNTRSKLPKVKELKKLHAKLWKIFSEYVRRKAQGRCYICHSTHDWRETDASHYLHGRLDYSETNVKACCRKCNRFMHGNLGLYAERLINDYGRNVLVELRQEAAQIKKWTIEELEAKIKEYKKKLSQLT